MMMRCLFSLEKLGVQVILCGQRLAYLSREAKMHEWKVQEIYDL